MTISVGGKLSSEFILELARGNIASMESLVVAGNNTSVGTSFEDVWDPGGQLVYPTAAETWEILSDNANDTGGGTGMRSVLVNSLDDSYERQSQLVVLDGVTPVALTDTHFRPRDIVGVTAGSNETNIGNITLRATGGGLTRGMIKSGNGSSHSSHFTTPAGETAFSLSFNIFVKKGEDVTVRASIKPGLLNSARFTIGELGIYQSSIDLPVFAPIPIPEKTDLKFEVKSSNDQAEITVFQELVLIKD